MSKLLEMYVNLKKQDPNTLFLFKSGIFYLAIDKDANQLSELLGLKLTALNNTTLKCGFPINSLNKYLKLLKAFNLKVKIIDVTNNTLYLLQEYEQSKTVSELLTYINNININHLSISEAYQVIEILKQKASQITSSESQ